jgi:hypothetical protein
LVLSRVITMFLVALVYFQNQKQCHDVIIPNEPVTVR